MALQYVVKNTFVHIIIDVEPAPARRCRSHPPRSSLKADDMVVSNEEPAPEVRRARLGKRRRARLHRLVGDLVETKLAEPAFDPLSVVLPPSIATSAERRQRMSALVLKLSS